MAININLYPPVVKTYMPAFVTDSSNPENTTCRVYFSVSPYNRDNITDIANVQVTVRDQNTNKSMLKKSDYPSAVKITSMQEDTSRTTDRFYIEIPESDIQGGWKINLYYRIQLRFTKNTASELTPGTAGLDTWLSENQEHFSEWSTVCLVRAISNPVLEIAGYNMQDGQVSWSLANTSIIGKLTFQDEDESDVLKQYQIKLYDAATNSLLTDSGIQYSNNYNEINSFNYTLKYNFIANTQYYFTVEYTTMANYHQINRFNFIAVQEDEELLEAAISATPDNENGRIEILIKRPANASVLTGSLVIRRCSSKDNFTIWEDMKSYDYEAVTNIKETWYDTTVESDIWYRYCVQFINADKKRGMWKELKTPILVQFEDMFLTTQDRQLKIKFNPNVSSFKRTIQESRVDTIGSQYPFIRRNGYGNYAQFPVGGLISFFMDEEELFTSREKLFGNQLNLYANYNDTNNINNYNNQIYERKFRDEVIKFLYDGEVKLFRSPTEGNFLVKVMDCSLSPTTQLGRYLWSFSGTAYEIADCTVEDMKRLNILEGTDI